MPIAKQKARPRSARRPLGGQGALAGASFSSTITVRLTSRQLNGFSERGSWDDYYQGELVNNFSVKGVEVQTSTPDQYQAFVRSEVARWGKVIKDAGIKGD